MLYGLFYAIVAACTFGLIPLFTIPLMEEGISTLTQLTYRFAISALILAAMALLYKQSLRIDRKDVYKLIGIGFFYTMAAGAFFVALEFMDSGIVATVQYSYPIFVVFGMRFIFKEPLRISTVTASIMICLGVAIFSMQGGSAVRVNTPGMLLTIFSASQLALYVMGIQVAGLKVQAQLVVSMYIMITSAFFSLILTLYHGSLTFPTQLSHWADLSLLALITGVISTLALVQSVRYIGSSLTSILGGLEPVTVMLVGVFILNEASSIQNILGTVCILSAVTLVAVATHRRKLLIQKQAQVKQPHKHTTTLLNLRD